MSQINPKMNNTVQEPDRTLNDYGFMGMTPHTEINPPTAYEVEGLGHPPQQTTTPLENKINPSGDSMKIDVGRSAGEIVAETRMGG